MKAYLPITKADVDMYEHIAQTGPHSGVPALELLRRMRAALAQEELAVEAKENSVREWKLTGKVIDLLSELEYAAEEKGRAAANVEVAHAKLCEAIRESV